MTTNQKRDAPGWAEDASGGPVCWKCRGTGHKLLNNQDGGGEKPCTVCFGAKRLPKKQLRRSKLKPERAAEIARLAPGPDFANVPVHVDDDVEEVCGLLGKWKIIQALKGGHRWSTDDLVTAWVACQTLKSSTNPGALARVRRHVDLGCGIGTVLMMCAWYLHAENQTYEGVGVEAQSASASKARRNLVMNALDDRRRIVESDFRDFAPTTKESFDLVTGTPPYFPVSHLADSGVAVPDYGALPTHEQSAPARFEFRGGLEAYVETASRLLTDKDDDEGLFVVCEGNLNMRDESGEGVSRVCRSAEANALRVERSVFVYGREDKPALFAVHVLRRRKQRIEEEAVPTAVVERFVVRTVTGERTEEYLAMCREMGILTE